MKSKADIHVIKRNFYQDRWNEKKVWEDGEIMDAPDKKGKVFVRREA